MKDLRVNLPTESRLKQRAKFKSKELGIKQTEALNVISQEHGFDSWTALKQFLKNNDQANLPIPSPSLNFTGDYDVEMEEHDYELLDTERSQDINHEKKQKIIENKKCLIALGIEFSVFEPTKTGFNKSILDATQSVRTHFELENFHFYWEQDQGPEFKITKEASLLTADALIPSRVSLYRPKTKNGDPRMWFKRLSEFSEAGDQIAIIIQNNAAFLINLNKSCLNTLLDLNESPIGNFLNEYRDQKSNIAMELLQKLREIAKSPFPAARAGDTAIGYTLETLLGISANSSKKPDYKGIEIKSGRGGKTRTTLFAQVADWDVSPCKKSAVILNKYGYERDGDFKLYCTVSTRRENTQGLSFIYDQSKDQLQEWYNKTDLVAVWPGQLLRDRLKEKHAETFWVQANSQIVDGVEHFELLSVTHTEKPILNQLLPLLEAGVITMDHLIKRDAKKNNRVSEKGPLFKINKSDLDLLFPKPVTYSLV